VEARPARTAPRAAIIALLQTRGHAVVTRDTQIRDLRTPVAQRIASEPLSEDSSVLRGLIGDLERRLAAETRRRPCRTYPRACRPGQSRTPSDAARKEFDAIEANLLLPADPVASPPVHLNGLVVL
jgi:hypothetical protein